jgi:hypothetical protein
MADPTPPGAYLFYLRYYKSIAAALAPDRGAALVRHMDSTITSDRVLGKLERPTPAEQIYFGDEPGYSDRGPVWALTRQDQADYLRTIQECPAIGVGKDTGRKWEIPGNPFNWLMVMVIKWYDENGGEQEVRRAVMMLAVHFYASLVFKFYTRKGGAQPNAMAYAVNSLSDKFGLKRNGNMFATLMTLVWSSHEKYRPNLAAASDESLMKYFVNMRNRINGMMVSIFNVYIGALSKGAYLNQSRETYDTGEMAERSTNSGRVQALTDKLAQSFVGEQPPAQAIDLAAKMADVPRLSLQTAINSMREREGTKIREIFQLTLEVFFEERGGGPEDVKTRSFFAFCTALYARSNTKDGRIERIKAILNELLASHSEFYTRTNREATKGAFRRAVWLYCVAFCQIRS